MNPPEHVVIVGAGHAGGRVAQHLRQMGYRKRLTLIGDEPHAPYERPALSKELLLGQKAPQDLAIAPPEFWETEAIERVCGRVTHVDASTCSLTLADGRELVFDRLVVASGGRARPLDIPGGDQPGVATLRTLDDSLMLREALRQARQVVIIGAGVIGMEIAASAAALGVQATVLEAGERILARCLPAPVADWLSGVHTTNGTRIETGVRIDGIERGDADMPLQVNVTQRNGTQLALRADLVLVAIGIACAVDFLDGTGIATAHGVPVDDLCRSPAAPWCYAVGDVATTYNAFYGRALRQETWRNAENQSRAVAEFILGRAEPYMEIPWMWTDQFGHNIQVVGQPAPDDEVVIRTTQGDRPATVLMLREGRIVGGVLIDNGRERRHLEALVKRSAMVMRERVLDATIPLKELA